jgi:uncharacterized protein (TIGR03118 family)
LDGAHPRVLKTQGSSILSSPTILFPFNVQATGDNIVVTYAMHEEGSTKSIPGPGLGYVDVFATAGQLGTRLDHGDQLNAPWGVTLSPLDFGSFGHELLIGQFAAGGTTQSAGFIAAYNLATDTSTACSKMQVELLSRSEDYGA